MEAFAPGCDWKPFRDWVLIMISCQLNANEQGQNGETWKWARIGTNLSNVASSTSHERTEDFALFDVCELINWVSTINSHIHSSVRSQKPLRTHMSKQVISEAIQTAARKGICQNRLWNLAVAGDNREEVDLPILMKMLQSKTLQQSSDHDTCTTEACCFTSIDSTRVEQLHKCPEKNCDDSLLFPFSKVEKQAKRITWWHDDSDGSKEGHYVVNTESQVQYMAISHVWSDGTGGGVQGQGHVNSCLFNYFKKIAEELKCKAIWWDTISIPTDRKARQEAISQMHKNFREASHTVIHDQSLAQFPWTDDGRSCLALLLSPWFTRAWTALELKMSQRDKVWVIYQDPKDSSQSVIKNLDTDVLAHHPAYSFRGHWVASSLISQLREQQFNSIGDILKVLRTRYTSWSRDLVIVAGLLTDHEPKVYESDFIVRITRDIILSLVEIEDSFLYHGHATMKQKGGFSWCPFSLLDVRLRTNMDRMETVYVDENGAVTGKWQYSDLSQEDAKKVQPYSFHISVDWQIRTALDLWRNCLLLKNPHHEDMQALLVIPLGVGNSKIYDKEFVVLECQYVGTVYISAGWSFGNKISVRLGKLTDADDPNVSRNAVIDTYFETLHGPTFSGLSNEEELKSTREARRRKLVRSEGHNS